MPADHNRAVLVLPESPYPPIWGNALRDVQQIALLQRLGYEVVLLCVRPRIGSSAAVDRETAARAGVRIELLSEAVRDLRETWAVKVGRKLGYLWSGNASHPFAWWCAPYNLAGTLPKRIAAMAPAAVVLRSLFVDLLPALRRAFGGTIVVDCHDADVHLAREMVRSVPWWAALGPLANYRGVRTVCRRWLPIADEVWAVSAEDAARIRPYAASKPVLVVPSSVDENQVVASAAPGCDDVCAMVANYGYGPNLNAARWFVKRVWPRVRRTRSAARLLLVGGRAEERVRGLAASAEGIEATGRLDDLGPIYAEAGVMLAPLLEGSGSRLKIVEAWKHGKAVLTTSKGIEGIAAPPEAAVITDQPAAFATSLASLMVNPQARHRLGEAGLRFLTEQLSFEHVAGELSLRSRLSRRVAPMRGVNA